MIPLIALAAVAILMLLELALSNRNERILERLGAIAPPDPVYGTMRWAYPGVFIAMAAEGVWRAAASSTTTWAGGSPSAATWASTAPPAAMWAGAALFLVSKLFKFWAIISLGHYWTYKVLVVPGAPLVARGPYRWIRHPNYVAVIGEIIAMALVTDARLAGPAGLLCFGALLLLRIRAEERALGLHA